MSKRKQPPSKTAVALRYDGKGAPRVTAKGEGYIAEQIQSVAQQHGIPMHEDANLVRLLSRVELNDEIPQALYLTVANVIAFAYMVAGKASPDQPDDN